MARRNQTPGTPRAGFPALLILILLAVLAGPGHAAFPIDPTPLQVAQQYAPVIYQDVTQTDPNDLDQYRQDLLTRFNYDGDWLAHNNAENVDQAFALTPYVYAWVTATNTHYFIGYAVFHPRDWGSEDPDHPEIPGDTHENDMECVLLTVPIGQSNPVAMITQSHGQIFLFGAPGIQSCVPVRQSIKFSAVSDDPFEQSTRPSIFIETQTHSIGRGWGLLSDDFGLEAALQAASGGPIQFVGETAQYDFRGDYDGVIYYPASSAGPEPARNERHARYELYMMDGSDGLWSHRNETNTVFCQSSGFIYQGLRLQPVTPQTLYGSFKSSQDGSTCAASPPWSISTTGIKARTDRYRVCASCDPDFAPTDFFFDPALLVRYGTTALGSGPAPTYSYNPFLGALGINQEEDLVSPTAVCNLQCTSDTPGECIQDPNHNHPFTFTWDPATDLGTGIRGYRYRFDTSAFSYPSISDPLVTGTSITVTAPTWGTYYFHVCAEDNADLLGESVHSSSWGFDVASACYKTLTVATSHPSIEYWVRIGNAAEQHFVGTTSLPNVPQGSTVRVRTTSPQFVGAASYYFQDWWDAFTNQTIPLLEYTFTQNENRHLALSFCQVATPPHVLFPNGGERLVSGNNATIYWSGDACGATQWQVELSRDNGANWTSLGFVPYATRSFVWTPASLPATSLARIRVKSVGGSVMTDVSDAAFTILDASAVMPTTLTCTPSSSSRTLAWVPHCSPVLGYEVHFSQGASGPWSLLGCSGTNSYTIAGCALPSVGSCPPWLGKTLEGGSTEGLPAPTEPLAQEDREENFYFRVVAVVGTGGDPAYDQIGRAWSSEVGSVCACQTGSSCVVSLVDPNGSEEYEIGALMPVIVEVSEDMGCSPIEVYLSRNNGTSWARIGQILIAKNRYQRSMYWPVSGPVSSWCRIRIVHSQGQDTSDGPFEIKASIGGGGGGGCPTLFQEEEAGLVAENTLLRPVAPDHAGQATSDQDDWYVLDRTPRSVGGSIQLDIAEFEQEASWLDEAGLEAIALPADATLDVDDEGGLVVARGAAAPQVARDAAGGDRLPEVIGPDDVCFPGSNGEKMEMSFPRPAGTGDFWLKIRARSKPPYSDGVGPEKAKTKEGVGGILIEATSPDGLSIREIGRVIPRELPGDRVLRIPTDIMQGAAESGLLHLRLTWSGDHPLDSVELLRGLDDTVLRSSMILESAQHSRAGDVLDALDAGDGRHGTLTPGERVTLSFRRTSAAGENEAFLFHVRGHYTRFPSEISEETGSVDPLAQRVTLGRPRPGGLPIEISCEMPAAGELSVKIVDVSGTFVRTVWQGRTSQGLHRATWDGRDDHGREVPRGVYFCVVSDEQARTVRKFVVVSR